MQQEEKCSLSARLAIPQKYVLSKASTLEVSAPTQ